MDEGEHDNLVQNERKKTQEMIDRLEELAVSEVPVVHSDAPDMRGDPSLHDNTFASGWC